MTEVPSVTGGGSNAVSAAGDGDARACRVSFGGVGISATDAAEVVMMHRTEVLKQVGADRTSWRRNTWRISERPGNTSTT